MVVAVMPWEAKVQVYAVLGIAGVSLLLQATFAPYDSGRGSTGE